MAEQNAGGSAGVGGAGAGGKTSMGMQPNVAGMLCYILGAITGLIFYLCEKQDKFVRFHAMQSIIVFGFFWVLTGVLTVIPVIGWMLIPIAILLSSILWIVLMIKAYQGEMFKLPVAGDIAEQNS